MGGFGSGEYERGFSRKKCVEECFAVDSFMLARELAQSPASRVCFDFKISGRNRFSVLASDLKVGYGLWAIIVDQNLNQLDVWLALHAVHSTKEFREDTFKGAEEVWSQGQPLSLKFGALFEPQMLNQEVVVSPTGSYCSYFNCPEINGGQRCSRRCRKLYWSHGRFACRQCHNLAYASQQKNPYNRLFSKAEKIRLKVLNQLGEEERETYADNALDFPPPPPYMTHRRYDTLYEQWDHCRRKAVALLLDHSRQRAKSILGENYECGNY